jgi:hypothetical protein
MAYTAIGPIRGVEVMNLAGCGKRQRQVRRNCANVVSDLVNDDLVVVAQNPKTVHKELTLTTLMAIVDMISIAAVNEETGPVTRFAKIISEATTVDQVVWEGAGEVEKRAGPKNTVKVICNMFLMGEQSTISYRP